MNHNYKNVILVVLFNYSNCTQNKNFIKKIYGTHFKKIIFYSDLPQNNDDDEINYINIERGFFGYKFFSHFYENYKSLLDESDGLFYTMDDNIINVNILNLFSTKKIIINPHDQKMDTIENHNGWAWDKYYGKSAILQLLEDEEFKKYNYNKFTGSFSDYFYLPKQYVNDKLYNLFKLYEKYNVFLEITIPSIIYNIELDLNKFNHHKSLVLWDYGRNLLFDKKYFYDSFKKNFNLIIHPIKFNQNPIWMEWLNDIFLKDKCIIITTINSPSAPILKFINKQDYDVIIVGDMKTPNLYKDLDCIYLDIDNQNLLFPELSSLIPLNHYGRKNLGYLYAIKKNYSIIYETDDDNEPKDNFENILSINNYNMIKEISNNWINIYKYFTDNLIWPRGYPLSLIKSPSNFSLCESDIKPSIICGLVESDPDVDSIYRLTVTNEVCWHNNKCVLISNDNICPFNTQNTFWLNKELFLSMIIPSTVSFRYCDILRGLICNVLLKYTNNNILFMSPNVVQIRNSHNLIEDFKSEYEMYITNEKILDYLNINKESSVKELMISLYNNLYKANIIKKLDVDILSKWLEYFE